MFSVWVWEQIERPNLRIMEPMSIQIMGHSLQNSSSPHTHAHLHIDQSRLTSDMTTDNLNSRDSSANAFYWTARILESSMNSLVHTIWSAQGVFACWSMAEMRNWALPFFSLLQEDLWTGYWFHHILDRRMLESSSARQSLRSSIRVGARRKSAGGRWRILYWKQSLQRVVSSSTACDKMHVRQSQCLWKLEAEDCFPAALTAV